MIRVIWNRTESVLESHLRKEQAGFRKGWSCIDLINTLTVILKQSNKWKGTLYPAFLDFEKAFASLARDISWQVMKIYSSKEDRKHDERPLWRIEMSCGPLRKAGWLLWSNNKSQTWLYTVTDPISCTARQCHEQDLDFADDIFLLSQRWSDKQVKLEKL
jgi:hypothetical protein